MKVPAFIQQRTTIQSEKTWQFYLSVAMWAVVYATMNVSIVIFLAEQFGSYFLAGCALALGNFCSLFFDIPFSYLQKVFSTRSLFLTSIITVSVSVMLFIFLLLFIEATFLKILFLFLATIIFSVSYDLYNITVTSYIMSTSTPANYGQNLSYKQLAQGIGLIGGLILSAVVILMSNSVQIAAEAIGAEIDHTSFLAATSMVMVFLLVLLIVLFFFAFIVFDRENVEINFKHTLEEFPANISSGFRSGAIKAIDVVENNLEKIKQNLQPNQIYLKNTRQKENFLLKEILAEIVMNFRSVVFIFKGNPKNYTLIWGTVVMTTFSFWDTFLATFQPAFMNQIMQVQKGQPWGFLPGNIVYLFLLIPVFILLTPFAKWGDKYGKDYFVIGGLSLTALSCFILGMVNLSAFFVVLLAGWGISIGYTAGMSCVKASFANKYNEYIAVFSGKNTIDTNASAGPMMMIENIGNIIGPLLGGAIISLMSFQAFFVVFSFFVGAIAILSLLYFQKITTPPYVFPENTEKEASSTGEFL